MTRPAYVRGRLPVVAPPDQQWENQTQTKPLMLNTLESVIYASSGQNKATEVNWLYFNLLQRKRAGFSRNMNGARLSIPDWQRRKLEIGNWKMTFKAGMYFEMSKITFADISTIPDWPEEPKLENRNSKLETGSCLRLPD